MAHQLAISLTDDGGPIYLQVTKAIVSEIERGRLRPGDELPSSRALAQQLVVHRKTINAAFAELLAQGWIVARPRSGTFVSEELPSRAPSQPLRAARTPGFELDRVALPHRPVSPRARFDLLGGVPAIETAPTVALARAYRRVVERDRRNALVDYGDPRGDLRLRAALATWLAHSRGLASGSDAIHTTRGSQNGLYLACHALLAPGDAIAVEAYTHPAVTSLLRLRGLEVISIPVDADGLVVDALEAAARTRPIRAVYTTPHHQLPTTVTLTASRRLRLLDLARARRWLVLEDDYDHEFQYAGQPVLPLAYLDRHGVVVYFGTLSKVVAPGLRLGFIVAPPPVIDRIAAYRRYVDQQGDQLTERAIAELIEDGEIERHTRRMLRIYRARRDALCGALASALPELRFEPPRGGMAVWAHAPGIDVDAWVRRALAAGVSFQPASMFAITPATPIDFARIGFAACTEVELREAVRLMVRALPRRTRPR